jgi:signal recognition particle subunit SRP68
MSMYSRCAFYVAGLINIYRFAHLLLLAAERAYAHAMSMKSTGTEDGTGLPGATRQHIANRMHKAAQHALQLANLLTDKYTTNANETDVLEAKAYAYTFAGAEQLERHGAGSRGNDVEAQREKWSDCLESYSAARVIYVALLKSTKDDVFKEHVASAIDPSIRFAAYQSHIPRTVPVVTVSRRCFPQEETDLVVAVEKLDPAAFDDKKAAGRDGAADIPNTITWRSRKANIADASIGQALASVSTETGRLEESLNSDDTKDKAGAYDPVLIAAQDAADATRHAIDDHEKEKISEADPRMQDLRVTNLAVNYELIGWRVGRNRVLIGTDDGAKLNSAPTKTPKKPRKDGKEWAEKPEGNGRKLAKLRERVVLYDAILQSLESVKEVPGAMRDSSFVEELEGKMAYFQALK